MRLWYVAVTRARDVFVAHTADEVDGWGEFPVKAGASEFVEYLADYFDDSGDGPVGVEE